MPSFDIVSEVDLHAFTNAVDQAQRVVDTRFDFKGVEAGFEREGHHCTLTAEADIQLEQMLDMLRAALSRCSIDPLAMVAGKVEASGRQLRQQVEMKHGLDQELARQIVRRVKDSRIKVQTQVQGDQVRVSGKKRDDLQQVIALLREASLGQPLQFVNFRD